MSGPDPAKVARNLAIAQRFYEAYHRSVERGRLDGAFDPADFAEEWVFWSPFLGGEMQAPRASLLQVGAAENHARISRRIPDYKMDDFRAWPTECGVAWRWRVNGTGIDGKHYEFWEQNYLWTDDAGQITRFEFFDDWHGFPQALAFAYDQPIEEITRLADYGRSPWTPAPLLTPGAAPRPPRREPPASPRIAANLAIAQAFFDGYHRSVERGRLEQAFDRRFFAEDWVLFSPWLGEMTELPDYGPVADFEHKKIWGRLPDYKMDHFEAWPTEDGCAWRWCVNGASAEGVRYSFWEQCFILTDEDGRIVRFEFFDDWQGFPQTLGFITGLRLDQLWNAEAYRAWVMGAQPA